MTQHDFKGCPNLWPNWKKYYDNKITEWLCYNMFAVLEKCGYTQKFGKKDWISCFEQGGTNTALHWLDLPVENFVASQLDAIRSESLSDLTDDFAKNTVHYVVELATTYLYSILIYLNKKLLHIVCSYSTV